MPRVTSPTTRFTAAEFERMAEAGLFDGRRVELINGRIYRVAPQNDPHMLAISKIMRALVTAAPKNERLVCQGALRLDRNTTVDPDFMWLPTPMLTPSREWPSPLLLIEVSDSTYPIDSGIKLRKYAKAGIRDYWIVNVHTGEVEVYRDPYSPDGKLAHFVYRDVTRHPAGSSIALLDRSDVVLSVDDLLP